LFYVICALCFVHCVLCIVFCALCFVLCVLCFTFCALCFVLCVLCFNFEKNKKNKKNKKTKYLFMCYLTFLWFSLIFFNFNKLIINKNFVVLFVFYFRCSFTFCDCFHSNKIKKKFCYFGLLFNFSLKKKNCVIFTLFRSYLSPFSFLFNLLVLFRTKGVCWYLYSTHFFLLHILFFYLIILKKIDKYKN